MSNHPNAAPGTPVPNRHADPRPVGPARDFAAFCELDRERRRNSDDDFDAELFDEAAALVVGRLAPQFSPQPAPNPSQGAAAERP